MKAEIEDLRMKLDECMVKLEAAERARSSRMQALQSRSQTATFPTCPQPTKKFSTFGKELSERSAVAAVARWRAAEMPPASAPAEGGGKRRRKSKKRKHTKKRKSKKRKQGGAK